MRDYLLISNVIKSLDEFILSYDIKIVVNNLLGEDEVK